MIYTNKKLKILSKLKYKIESRESIIGCVKKKLKLKLINFYYYDVLTTCFRTT